MRINANVRMVLVSAFAVAVPVAAQETPALSSPPSTAALHPHWTEQPSGDDIARVYPPYARRRSVGGQAEIRCLIALDGRMKDCAVLTEAPDGEGFGAAALKLAPFFRMGWKDGPPSPVNGSLGIVRIPILFHVAQ